MSGQRPTLSGHVSGELVVAQVPASRRRPAPLPGDVQRAIDSDDRFTRLGAIVRLEQMLRGEDAGLAAAARLALVALTDDDSRQVYDAAAAALTRVPEAAPPPSPPPLPPPPPPAEPGAGRHVAGRVAAGRDARGGRGLAPRASWSSTSAGT